MKRSLINKILPLLAPVLGLLGAVAMWALFAFGTDDRGLLISFHPAALTVWLLTAVMIVSLLALLRKMEDTAGHRRLFPESHLAAFGTLCAAVGILATVVESLTAMDEPIRIISGVLKLAAGIALIYLAWCRWKNVRGSFLAWVAVTAYMLLRIMFEYRSWSTQPEVLEFFFPLLASVCMVLAMYHRTAFCVKMGSRSQFLFFTQLGAFCCLVALPTEPAPFYAGMALWAMLDRCSLKVVKSKTVEAPPEETA